MTPTTHLPGEAYQPPFDMPIIAQKRGRYISNAGWIYVGLLLAVVIVGAIAGLLHG